MDRESNEYGLRIMIEEMQQRGCSEREIEAAVRAATRSIPRRGTPPASRSRRLGTIGRRLLGAATR